MPNTMQGSRIVWDKSGERRYETGVDHGVLYPKTLTGSYVTNQNGGYATGVPWNGLTSVNENPSGGEANPLWADNIKYLNLVSNEDFGGTIEAYTYPEEFEECDGSKALAPGLFAGQQRRKEFGFTYRTLVGNDESGTDLGYKLHIVYGALAAPSGKQYNTVNESPDAIQFSWEFSTTPIVSSISGLRPTAHLVIDSTKTMTANGRNKILDLEDILYGKDPVAASGDNAGSDGVYPRLPLPDEVITILGGTINSEVSAGE